MATEPCSLIVCPARCYVPDEMRRGKIWAISTQLYALRSERNWGIGDFTDLENFAQIAAKAGARAIALNPLHELHLHNPQSASPYSPSSRLFLNVLYIDVERVPEFQENREARALIDYDAFQQRLAEARSEDFVDYAGVAGAKLLILEKLYRVFIGHHLDNNDARGQAFRRFVKTGGLALERLAIYEALAQHFGSRDSTCYGWRQWPVEYRSPASPEVARFAREHRSRVDFFLYLQWIAEEQLAELPQRDARRAHLWLYLDLAVGADANGADVWADQDAFVVDASLGAPADPLNTHGQNWGLAPFSPLALRQRCVSAVYRAAARQHAPRWNFAHRSRHGAAPRVLDSSRRTGVERARTCAIRSTRCSAFWRWRAFATNAPSSERILEPSLKGLRERMESAGALSTRLFYFQRNWSAGTFLPPAEYPRLAAVSVGTHDLPTLAGWWTGDRSAYEDRAARSISFD